MRLWETFKGDAMDGKAKRQVPKSRLAQIFLGVHNNQPPSPQSTSLTRGLVAGALTELIAIIVNFSPLPLDDKTFILSHTGSIVVLLSFIVYGFLDSWLKKRGLK